MVWLIAYLISVIVVPTIFGMFRYDTSKSFDIDSPEDVLKVAGFCVLWPICITTAIIASISQEHVRNVNEWLKTLKYAHGLEHLNPHDRTHLVEMNEDDLKFILKCYRKGYREAKLSAQNIEMIREELMNRNAERSLLR